MQSTWTKVADIASRLTPPALRADRVREPRLVALVSTFLIAEAGLYGCIAPLLPRYAEELRLTTTAAGVLLATYPAGSIAGMLLAPPLSGAVGFKRATVLSLIATAICCVGFGLASSLIVLGIWRAAQGVALGCLRSCSVAWILAASSPREKGRTLAVVLAAATAGTLFGQALGTVGVLTSPRLAFLVVGGGLLILIPSCLSTPSPAPSGQARDITVPWHALPAGFFLVVGLASLAPLLGATINTLIPLRLHRLGTSNELVSVTFLAKATATMLAAGFVARGARRQGAPWLLGRTVPIAVICAIGLAIPAPAGVVAAVTIGTGIAGSAVSIPASVLVTEESARLGLSAASAATLLLLAGAAGETLAGPVSAALTQTIAGWAPFALLAAVLAATAMVRGPSGGRAAPPP